MGMYTELNIGFRLKRETPPNVVTALQSLVDGVDVTLDHPFFTTARGQWCLRSAGSYYFPCPPMRRVHVDSIDSRRFGVVTNIKNYDREWELFLDWIGPYVDANEGEYLGTYRYEEEARPTFIVMGDGKLVFENPASGERSPVLT